MSYIDRLLAHHALLMRLPRQGEPHEVVERAITEFFNTVDDCPDMHWEEVRQNHHTMLRPKAGEEIQALRQFAWIHPLQLKGSGANLPGAKRFVKDLALKRAHSRDPVSVTLVTMEDVAFKWSMGDTSAIFAEASNKATLRFTYIYLADRRDLILNDEQALALDKILISGNVA